MDTTTKPYFLCGRSGAAEVSRLVTLKLQDSTGMSTDQLFKKIMTGN
jgi:hypothetical protein